MSEPKRFKIAFIGGKGGSGKTTSTHLAALGYGILGIESYVGITDTKRRVLPDEFRPYKIIDARNSAKANTFAKVSATYPKDSRFIMDSGLLKHEVDSAMAKWAGVVIIPCCHSEEDTNTAEQDIRTLINSYGIDPKKVVVMGSRMKSGRTADLDLQGASYFDYQTPNTEGVEILLKDDLTAREEHVADVANTMKQDAYIEAVTKVNARAVTNIRKDAEGRGFNGKELEAHVRDGILKFKDGKVIEELIAIKSALYEQIKIRSAEEHSAWRFKAATNVRNVAKKLAQEIDRHIISNGLA